MLRRSGLVSWTGVISVLPGCFLAKPSASEILGIVYLEMPFLLAPSSYNFPGTSWLLETCFEILSGLISSFSMASLINSIFRFFLRLGVLPVWL